VTRSDTWRALVRLAMEEGRALLSEIGGQWGSTQAGKRPGRLAEGWTRWEDLTSREWSDLLAEAVVIDAAVTRRT
jgi:hypothetical protein